MRLRECKVGMKVSIKNLSYTGTIESITKSCKYPILVVFGDDTCAPYKPSQLKKVEQSEPRFEIGDKVKIQFPQKERMNPANGHVGTIKSFNDLAVSWPINVMIETGDSKNQMLAFSEDELIPQKDPLLYTEEEVYEDRGGKHFAFWLSRNYEYDRRKECRYLSLPSDIEQYCKSGIVPPFIHPAICEIKNDTFIFQFNKEFIEVDKKSFENHMIENYNHEPQFFIGYTIGKVELQNLQSKTVSIKQISSDDKLKLLKSLLINIYSLKRNIEIVANLHDAIVLEALPLDAKMKKLLEKIDSLSMLFDVTAQEIEETNKKSINTNEEDKKVFDAYLEKKDSLGTEKEKNKKEINVRRSESCK